MGNRSVVNVDWEIKWDYIVLILFFILFPLVILTYGWVTEKNKEEEKNFIDTCNSINYEVRENDSIWSIAVWAMKANIMKQNVDIRQNVDYILAKNMFARSEIKSGDILKIPITRGKEGSGGI